MVRIISKTNQGCDGLSAAGCFTIRGFFCCYSDAISFKQELFHRSPLVYAIQYIQRKHPE